jgi:hypothetical protein
MASKEIRALPAHAFAPTATSDVPVVKVAPAATTFCGVIHRS